MATGSDQRLYHIESNGSQYHWQRTFGPGQFLGTASSWVTLNGCAEILGEGTDHQLAYAHVTPEQDRDNIEQWENLGRPGEAGSEMGLNGRPAVVFDSCGLHVLVRGQDNHLWHTFGKDNDHQAKRTFASWTHDVHGSGSTFIFGRGVHDELWYRQRNGANWEDRQSLGEGLTGDPAVRAMSLSNNGEGVVSCVVLRQNGVLWLRELQLTGEEYSGRTSRGE